MQLAYNRLELLKINNSVSVVIEQGENSPQAILGLGFSNLGSNAIDELIEVNGLVFVLEPVDELQDERIPLVKTQLLKDFVDFTGVDSATGILIENIKSALELFPVFRSKSVLPGGGLSLARSGGRLDSAGGLLGDS